MQNKGKILSCVNICSSIAFDLTGQFMKKMHILGWKVLCSGTWPASTRNQRSSITSNGPWFSCANRVRFPVHFWQLFKSWCWSKYHSFYRDWRNHTTQSWVKHSDATGSIQRLAAALSTLRSRFVWWCEGEGGPKEKENISLSCEMHLHLTLFSDIPSPPCLSFLCHQSTRRVQHQWKHPCQVEILWQLAVCNHGWGRAADAAEEGRGLCHHYAICTLQRLVGCPCSVSGTCHHCCQWLFQREGQEDH